MRTAVLLAAWQRLRRRMFLNADMQQRMEAEYGYGYDSGEIARGLDDPLLAREYRATGGNYKIIFDELVKPRLTPGATVLEIGPGRGSWTQAVLENFPSGTLHVIERLPLEGMIRRRCPWAGDRLRFHRTSTNDYSMFADGSFDFAFSFGVFVHLPLREIEVILRRLRPKMRQGGEVILQYSNWDKLDRWGWERAEVPVQFKDDPEHPDVCWTRNDCPTMERLCTAAGFRIESLDLNYFGSCSTLDVTAP